MEDLQGTCRYPLELSKDDMVLDEGDVIQVGSVAKFGPKWARLKGTNLSFKTPYQALVPLAEVMTLASSEEIQFARRYD